MYLASLPPTAAAIENRSVRVYLQVQTWRNKDLNLIQWVWRHSVNGLVPTGTNAPPAPSNMLKMGFCSCTKGCSAACGCQKVGIFCNNVCVCKGGCLNSESVEDEDEDM